MVYLVRHGQTDANLKNLVEGQSGNSPLNETGRQQAQKLASFFMDKNISEIYTSPLERAYETTDVIAKNIGVSQEVDELLMEVSYGLWEGQTIEQILENYPQMYDNWKNNPTQMEFVAGESFGQIMERVDLVVSGYFYSDVAEENILIVSHEDFIRSIIYYITQNTADFWRYDIPNASITTFKSEADELKILEIGQTKHLSL